MKALDNITINQKYGLVLKEDIENTNRFISNQKQQIERLREQLNEANEVIKEYDSYTYALEPGGKVVCREANNAHFYLEKWGVK